MMRSFEVKGNSLPEAFYKRVKADPTHELYFTKRQGQWISKTYGAAFQFMLRTMAGLKKLGFGPDQKISIISENREEWMLTDYSAQWLGGVTAAIYATSTPDQIRYILNEAEVSILFVSTEEMLGKVSELKDLPKLKTIVAWNDIPSPKVPAGVRFVTREEFLNDSMPEAEAVSLLDKITADTLAVLLYTSGTTGEPKGVMLTQRAMVTNVQTMIDAFPSVIDRRVTLSFLPLSHIYERVLHSLMLMVGLNIYFAESMDKIIDNIAEVRPDCMIFVPRIFEKMYVKVMDRIRNGSHLSRKIFALAIRIGHAAFPYRYKNLRLPFHLKILYAIADALVFKKIRAVTGGRAKLFISGGAPLSQEIAEFFFTAGFTISEGYGLSETCIIAANRVGEVRFGTVGKPFDAFQVRIAEDGEICVKGPCVMKGYYKRPDATAEVIDRDGWFHTGDIGEFDAEGCLKITDRKKDLIVTAGGKKVAPQPIENALKSDPLIESVCLLGDTKKYVVALVVPNLELCRSWGQTKGLSIKSMEDCARQPQLKEHFQKEFEKINSTLPHYSTIKDFRVLATPFTIESGELTPTLKLKRRVIQDKFKDLIESMYAAG